jgi:FkbM family methyltransferase
MTAVPCAKPGEGSATEAETEGWSSRLRRSIVEKGISIMCPNSSISTDVAADIPLFSGGVRLAYLKALAALGIANFVARSGLGHDFVCHVGDLAEFPFYHPGAYRAELELASAWLLATEQPLAFDVGANEGFFACQLAQMAGQQCKIYAFDPVPETFAKLAYSVSRLGLTARVEPICAAVLDSSRVVELIWPARNSLHARVTPQLNGCGGHRSARANAIPLDTFCAVLGRRPSLLKIDAEGSEPAVLRGAAHLLAGSERPAILLEFNPITLAECGEDVDTFTACLTGYILYYVDDLRGQVIPFGEMVDELRKINWICNLFAVPKADPAVRRWAAVSRRVRERLPVRPRKARQLSTGPCVRDANLAVDCGAASRERQHRELVRHKGTGCAVRAFIGERAFLSFGRLLAHAGE